MPLEDANLTGKDGTVVKVQVPGFPGYPELVRIQDGRLFAANSPVIGYGNEGLGYHEVSVYEVPR